jgi:hypothetical protein
MHSELTQLARIELILSIRNQPLWRSRARRRHARRTVTVDRGRDLLGSDGASGPQHSIGGRGPVTERVQGSGDGLFAACRGPAQLTAVGPHGRLGAGALGYAHDRAPARATGTDDPESTIRMKDREETCSLNRDWSIG